MVHGRIPTRVELAKRGCSNISVWDCPFCVERPEIVSHLFCQCRVVWSIWCRCFRLWGISTVIPGEVISFDCLFSRRCARAVLLEDYKVLHALLRERFCWFCRGSSRIVLWCSKPGCALALHGCTICPKLNM
ncbi:hypothetical protein V6N13_013090 [Hibiscus sabdariffa]